MREILVIRFGALGDLCVLGWALSRLADSAPPGSQRVTLVTKTANVALMSEMRGVDAVIGLEGTGLSALWRLARRLRDGHWDLVIDAHNVLRSHLLLGLLGRRPAARLNKDTGARLQLMTVGRKTDRLNRRMIDRFDALLAASGLIPTASQPDEITPPLSALRPSPADSHRTPRLGIAPGAQWDTKRWPEANFAHLLALFCGHGNGEIRIYLGPREQSWYATSELATVAATEPRVSLVQNTDLVSVARDLATCDVVVTNDSGLLHVAEAVGTRVLAFFGPTVREFGYFPLLAASRVLETDVSCRPCSRNGKRPCHQERLLCLADISPETALREITALLDPEAVS